MGQWEDQKERKIKGKERNEKNNGRVKRNERTLNNGTMGGSKGTKEQWESQRNKRTMQGSKERK